MNVTSTYIKWNVAIDLLTKLEKDAKEYGHYKFAMFFAFNIGLLTAFAMIYNNEEDKNTSARIINRHINFPAQDCYNDSDLKLIIYGQ